MREIPLLFTADVTWSNVSAPAEIPSRGIGVRFLKLSRESQQFLADAI